MNGPLWRTNRPIIDQLQHVVDFLVMFFKIILLGFGLSVTLRLLWFLLTKIF
ncbi:hypothetical protein ACFL6S_21620 [Candidatus Poribacteria bacterium]